MLSTHCIYWLCVVNTLCIYIYTYIVDVNFPTQVWHDFIRHSEQDQDRILNMQKDNSHLCEIEELPDDTVHDSAMEVTGSGVFRQR